VTADYGISAYFKDERGIYVNLFVPSKVTWNRSGGGVSLTQQTSYPHDASTTITVAADKPSSFPVYVRIPAWAGPKTAIAVNGKPADAVIVPGQFAEMRRTWRNGDRIEVEFAMATRLEPVDAQHPALVAAVHGPLALFAVGQLPASVSRAELMSVAQTSAGAMDWKTLNGSLSMRPFTAIHDEHYRLYQSVGRS